MNDRLRICPRCGKKDCACVERVVADALAKLGTGVTNVDIVSGMRWVSSLRQFQRTAFIELKNANEGMGVGQEMCLHDLTGQMWTCDGLALYQRSFLIQQIEGCRFALSTFSRTSGSSELVGIGIGSIEECVQPIWSWLQNGSIESEGKR